MQDTCIQWYINNIHMDHIYVHLESKWPLSLKVNPPETRPFALLNKDRLASDIYIYMHVIYDFCTLISPCTSWLLNSFKPLLPDFTGAIIGFTEKKKHNQTIKQSHIGSMGQKRYMYQHTWFMFPDISCGKFVMGNIPENVPWESISTH